jgi:hypothetical protein
MAIGFVSSPVGVFPTGIFILPGTETYLPCWPSLRNRIGCGVAG